jgi:hypothetical protein
VVVPFPEVGGGSNFLCPFINHRFGLLKSPRPKPVHKDPAAIIFEWWIICALDMDNWFDNKTFNKT